MKMPLLLIIFGSIGVLARYYLDLSVPSSPGQFPLATFIINILGSFLIGILFVIISEKALLEPDLGVALMVGLLGGFTTFSAFSLQIVRLWEGGNTQIALLYAILSPIVGVLAAVGGIFGARLLVR